MSFLCFGYFFWDVLCCFVDLNVFFDVVCEVMYDFGERNVFIDIICGN